MRRKSRFWNSGTAPHSSIPKPMIVQLMLQICTYGESQEINRACNSVGGRERASEGLAAGTTQQQQRGRWRSVDPPAAAHSGFAHSCCARAGRQ